MVISTRTSDKLHDFVRAVETATGCTAKETRGNGRTQYLLRCPAHDDGRASLSVSQGDSGAILVKCFAGCGAADIASAVGWELRDLMPPLPDPPTRGNGNSPKIVATYDYRAADGHLLFQVCRFDPKDFRQRRPDGNGGWVWNMQGVELVPYRLPQLVAAPADEWVFICEGEKDCDNLAALNLIATCNVGGAGKWKPTYNQHFAGRMVCVVADKDAPGRRHAQDVARNLHGIVKWLRVVEVPIGKDASDWISALPEGSEKGYSFIGLAETNPEWGPANVVNDNQTATSDTTPTTHQKVDNRAIAPRYATVTALCDKYPSLRGPIVFKLLRRGETMNIIAPPKVGKTWLATSLVLSIADGRHWLGYETVRGDVLYIDNELHGETIAHRVPKVAEALGIKLDEVGDRVCVESLRGGLVDLHAMRGYFDQLERDRFSVIVLDAFYRFLPRGTDENSNADVTSLYNILDDAALALNCAFVLIHHSTKGSQAGKVITDVGAGAGAQARAADTHVILRRHAEPGCYVMEAAARSWAPIEPAVLRWGWPVWTLAPDLDPADLQPDRPKRTTREPEPSTAREAPWTAARFVKTFLTSEGQTQAAIVDSAVGEGLSQRNAKSLLQAAEDKGLCFRWASANPNKPQRFATVEQPLIEELGVSNAKQ